MKKSLVLLVALFVSVLSVQAQSNYSGEFFTISVPAGWEGQEVELEGGEAVSIFSVNGKDFYGAIVISAIPGFIDPEEYISLQISEVNPIFKGANFSEVEKSDFQGYTASSVDFESKFDGMKVEGSAVAFNTEASTYFMVLYTPRSDVDFGAVLSTFEVLK